MKKRKTATRVGKKRNAREIYLPPKVTIVELSSQEALMGICKAAGSPCQVMVAVGS